MLRSLVLSALVLAAPGVASAQVEGRVVPSRTSGAAPLYVLSRGAEEFHFG